MLKETFCSFMLFSVFLAFVVKAGDITVTKTAPSEIAIGQNLTVIITITNGNPDSVHLTVRENIGDAQAISPQLIVPTAPHNIIAALPPYFQWSLTVNGSSQTNITYVIRPNKVSTYLFSPTIATADDGTTYSSDTPSTSILCNSNGLCEPNVAENYGNCAQDCPSGSRDGYCDGVLDGKCDPDCEKTADIDCTCGNGICDPMESIATCPKDCGGQLAKGLESELTGAPSYLVVGAIVAVAFAVSAYVFRFARRRT